MSEFPNPLLRPYMKLPEFLGNALGPDYEIALHDLTDKNHSVVAISNGYLSGREVGAPLGNMSLNLLKDKRYEASDYLLHYPSTAVNGKELRSNTMFIKHEGKPIGMLCINFNDNRYRALCNSIMSLCHPDTFLSEPPPIPAQLARKETAPERTHPAKDAATLEAVEQELKRLGVAAERLTTGERRKIIAALEKSGLFLLKSAVKDVAEALHCSKASVYRYLSALRGER